MLSVCVSAGLRTCHVGVVAALLHRQVLGVVRRGACRARKGHGTCRRALLRGGIAVPSLHPWWRLGGRGVALVPGSPRKHVRWRAGGAQGVRIWASWADQRPSRPPSSQTNCRSGRSNYATWSLERPLSYEFLCVICRSVTSYAFVGPPHAGTVNFRRKALLRLVSRSAWESDWLLLRGRLPFAPPASTTTLIGGLMQRTGIPGGERRL